MDGLAREVDASGWVQMRTMFSMTARSDILFFTVLSCRPISFAAIASRQLVDGAIDS